MVRPMAPDNTTNTATADSKPELEQDEAPDTERLPQPPHENVADKDDTEQNDTDQNDTVQNEADQDEAASAEVPARTASGGGAVAGGAAIVSAGLGLSSLTGTGLSDMLRSRQELVGQIEASIGGGGGDQIEAIYGAPWHTTALINGIFALAAIVIGGVLFAVLASRGNTPAWVRAVALAGTALGVVGVLVAGGMYLDLFAAQPELPQIPGLGG
jgi:hypothetical protein